MDDFLTVVATGANITTSATTASVAIPPASSGEIPRYVRVSSTAGARFRMGKGATTALATDILIQPNAPVVLSVPRGYDTAAAIQDTAAGTVNIVPLENC